MGEIIERTSHRPWPLPEGRWAMTQRWNDLLFAHWPMRIAEIEAGKDYKLGLLTAVHLLRRAWEQVTEETIKNCFRHAIVTYF